MAILQHLMHQSLQNTCCSSQSWDLWCAASVNRPVALRCRMSLSGVIARVFISTYCAAGCTSMCHCARNWTDSGSQDSERGAVAGGEEAATACSPPFSCSNTNTWTVGVGFSALPSCLIFYSAKGAWRPRHNCIQKKWLLMFTQPFFLFCFSFIYSSLYFLYAHRLPVHLTALCWSHPPALLPSSPQFSSCGSLFPRLGNINMATQQKYAPVLYKHGNRCTIICSQMMQTRWLHLVVVSTDKEGS